MERGAQMVRIRYAGWAALGAVIMGVALAFAAGCASQMPAGGVATTAVALTETPLPRRIVVYDAEGARRVVYLTEVGATPWISEGIGAVTDVVRMGDELAEQLLALVPTGVEAVIRVGFLDLEGGRVRVLYLDGEGRPLVGGEARRSGDRLTMARWVMDVPDEGLVYGMAQGNLVGVNPGGEEFRMRGVVATLQNGDVVTEELEGSLEARYDWERGEWQRMPAMAIRRTGDSAVDMAIARARGGLGSLVCGG